MFLNIFRPTSNGATERQVRFHVINVSSVYNIKTNISVSQDNMKRELKCSETLFC